MSTGHCQPGSRLLGATVFTAVGETRPTEEVCASQHGLHEGIEAMRAQAFVSFGGPYPKQLQSDRRKGLKVWGLRLKAWPGIRGKSVPMCPTLRGCPRLPRLPSRPRSRREQLAKHTQNPHPTLSHKDLELFRSPRSDPKKPATQETSEPSA